ncbi:hypothetical protein AB0B44_39465, partial [Streptomyces sp. NPDC041003]
SRADHDRWRRPYRPGPWRVAIAALLLLLSAWGLGHGRPPARQAVALRGGPGEFAAAGGVRGGARAPAPVPAGPGGGAATARSGSSGRRR